MKPHICGCPKSTGTSHSTTCDVSGMHLPIRSDGCRAAPACVWPQPPRVLPREERGLEDGDRLILQMWTPRRKIHFMWILRRSLSTEMNSPWSIKGPDFINSKSLRDICWQGLSCILYVGKKLWLNSQLLALGLFPLSELTTAGKPWIPLSTNGPRPALSSQDCTIISSFTALLTNQPVWIWKPDLHKIGSIGNLF